MLQSRFPKKARQGSKWISGVKFFPLKLPQFDAAANSGRSESAPETFVCAISRFISGMHEPQLVPAFNLAPISAAVLAPAAMAARIVLRPTPKQAQTTGPALANPSADLPGEAGQELGFFEN